MRYPWTTDCRHYGSVRTGQFLKPVPVCYEVSSSWMDRMTSVLTDRQRAVLAPLIEACRPHRKTRHHDLQRTIEAITWRCQESLAAFTPSAKVSDAASQSG